MLLTLRHTAIAVFSALIMVASITMPAAATENEVPAGPATAPSASLINMDLSTYDGPDTPFTVVELPKDPSLMESVTNFGLSGESRVVVTQERSSLLRNGSAQPQFSVGLGWFIYVYLDRGDWIWLAGLGAAGATTALCGWLLPTLGPQVACAMAAFIVVFWIIARTAPPSGYCREFKFRWGGQFAGTRLVQRSC